MILKKIWKDPVGSKLIASMVIGLLTIIVKLIANKITIIDNYLKTNIVVNIEIQFFILSIVIVMSMVVTIIVKYSSLSKSNNVLRKRLSEFEKEQQIPIPERLKQFNDGDIVKFITDKVGDTCKELVVTNKTKYEVICSYDGQESNYSPDELNTAKEYNFQKKEYDEFIVKAEKTIRFLHKEQLDLLRMLSEQEQKLDIRWDGVIYLEKQKYIKKVNKISSREFIFEINLAIKEIVLSHLCSLREQSILKFISNLTRDERYFLSMFYSKTVLEGTQESSVKMKSLVFESGKSMSDRGYLVNFAKKSNTSNIESFRLLQDTAKQLTDKVFNRIPQRNELHLELKYIEGSLASGGGSRGSL
jgi:hypothetical protein